MKIIQTLFSILFSFWLVLSPSLNVNDLSFSNLDFSFCIDTTSDYLVDEHSCHEPLSLSYNSHCETPEKPCESKSDCNSCCRCTISHRVVSFVYNPIKFLNLNQKDIQIKRMACFFYNANLIDYHHFSIWNPPQVG